MKLDAQAAPAAQAAERVQTPRVTENAAAITSPTAAGRILRLQQSHGNRRVRRALALARQAAESTAGDAAGGALDPGVEASIQSARGGGQALDGAVRAQMEPALGTDLSGVRVHTGGEADRLNQAVSARAFTTGSDVFFRAGEYNPGSSAGRELLAHELTHVVQQKGAAPVQAKLTLGPVDDPAEREADDVARQVIQGEATGGVQRAPAPALRRQEIPAETGGPGETAVLMASDSMAADEAASVGEEPGAVVAAKRLPGAAAAVIRRKPPGASPAAAPKKAAPGAHTYYGPFTINIPGTISSSEAAILSLEQVLNIDRATAAELAAGSAWSSFSLSPAELASRKISVRLDASFFRKVSQKKRGGEAPDKAAARAASLATAPAETRKEVKQDTDEEFERRTNRKAPGKGASPADRALWEDIQEEVLFNRENAQRWQALPPDLKTLLTGGGTPPPKDLPRFLRIAEKLAKATVAERALYFRLAKTLARDLGEFEGSVDAFLVERAAGAAGPGGGAAPGTAPAAAGPGAAPAGNDIDAGTVLWSFVKTVAVGIGVLALAGIVVGAEILTAGQVTWILIGVAGAGGLNAYLDRRDEIEKSGYDVPGYVTAIHAAGDAVGLSPLLEGATGERLGTGQKLGTEKRSEQLGAGLGSIAVLLTGSRAFRQGQSIGQSIRAPQPGLTPAGPNAAADVRIPQDQMPARPARNPNPGPREQALRESLSTEDQAGLDRWSEELRARGKDPEGPLGKMREPQIRSAIEKARKGYEVEVEKAEDAAHQQARATDDPLRPQLKHVEKKGDIEIHYESRPPSAEEIAHAQAIAKSTGEPVKLFGDTASKINYPGIDGTIGNPPRPLSLKSYSPDANAGAARFAAQEGLAKAKAQGYTQVEVDVSMPGKTVAEVKAAWDTPPTRPGDHPLSAVYEGSIVAKLIIRCSDGVWIVPKGPAVTSTVPSLPGKTDDKGDNKAEGEKR